VIPPALEEPAVAAFWDSGCLGVQVLASGRDRRLTLDAYFPGQADRRRLDARLRRALCQSGLGADTRPRLSAAPAGRWVERWQRTLRPMAIGPFLVVPEGCRAPAARGREILRVRFGQAFGTGEHATTRMCLRLLQEHLRSGQRVVDLGTGSGILAMAACRLGAGRVVAADNDEVALEVARSNLADNGLLERIEMHCTDAGRACRLGPFDLALVNIGASTIERILPDLAGALAPGGRAILAGLLVDDEERLLRAAARSGLVLLERRRSRPWSALVLCRS
jgi:ribosomal protein L11 methyltransferase